MYSTLLDEYTRRRLFLATRFRYTLFVCFQRSQQLTGLQTIVIWKGEMKIGMLFGVRVEPTRPNSTRE